MLLSDERRIQEALGTLPYKEKLQHDCICGNCRIHLRKVPKYKMHHLTIDFNGEHNFFAGFNEEEICKNAWLWLLEQRQIIGA